MRLKLFLLSILIFLVCSCEEEHPYFVAYKMNLNAKYQYTTQELVLKNGKCEEIISQKNFGEFQEERSSVMIPAKYCHELEVAAKLKTKFGSCVQGQKLLQQDRKSDEETYLVFDSNCLCYEYYLAGKNNLDSPYLAIKKLLPAKECLKIVDNKELRKLIQ